MLRTVSTVNAFKSNPTATSANAARPGGSHTVVRTNPPLSTMPLCTINLRRFLHTIPTAHLIADMRSAVPTRKLEIVANDVRDLPTRDIAAPTSLDWYCSQNSQIMIFRESFFGSQNSQIITDHYFLCFLCFP